MAELHLYKCKKCGWEVESPSEGADMLMDSIMACYVCHDCQHVFKKYYALGTVFDGKEPCPLCKGYNTQNWEPNDVIMGAVLLITFCTWGKRNVVSYSIS